MGYETLETVLGLSMTPTSLGLVLVDGEDADGPTLARDELSVARGTDAGNASEQATAAALRLQSMVEAQGQRLRGIGVTWSDDAVADAALLVESLTEAGFDNVVPVRFPHAAESLAHGVDPVAGSERTAVCVVEAGLATAVSIDDGEDAGPVVAQQEIDGDAELVDWLATLFAPGRWRPAVLILAGAGTGNNALAVRVERELALPVFVRSGAQLGLARGAAQALGPSADLAAVPALSADDDAHPERAWTLPYAGAMAMLVVGVVSFVVSASAAVSLELTPANGPRPTERVAHAPTAPAAPPVSHAVRPAVAEAPPKPPEPPSEATDSDEPAAAEADEPVTIGSIRQDPQADVEVDQPVPPAPAP